MKHLRDDAAYDACVDEEGSHASAEYDAPALMQPPLAR